MASENARFLDEHLRLRLATLPPEQFELFFLHFLRAGISLTIERHGSQATKRIVSAERYAAGTGRQQRGIDLRVIAEGGEVWAFQCKRHKTWTPEQTKKAIEKASQYKAQHYFLAVSCDPHEDVQDLIHKYPNWTFWNLDTICAEFRLRVSPSKHAQVLFFLSPEELKRFAPFTTNALISPEEFFGRFLGSDKFFRHDWKLVGRETELQLLREFVTGTEKVKVVTAKGGDGKSKLLWELSRSLAEESPETEVLALNPHRGDDLSFSFVGNPSRRVILVDDAHRTEQVPVQLLALIRQDPVSKVVLATRPQGTEALAHKFHETGLSNSVAPALLLGSLRQSDAKALASETLGEGLKDHADALAELTKDCPLLTVLAGELLRSGRLEWGKWASNDEFHQHVFREFEQKNLESIPEVDRSFAGGLVRMLALLAPAVVDSTFTEKSARSLGCSVFALETQLARLRQRELVAGRDDGLRIVPDLFADFLVYDTCYGSRKMPGFVQQVLREFSDRSPALLRNLSEATWVARINGVADETLLKTVLEPEFKRFKESSFYERAEGLKHWSGFSVYLPAESLELASLALRLDSAPEAKDEWTTLFDTGELNSYKHVCQQIPLLLRPLAKYHDSYRNQTLELLWNLGLQTEWVRILGNNQSHPWSVIAEVIKYEPRKRPDVVLSALNWLEYRIQKPDSLVVLEGNTPILRTLVAPCFERFVEFTEWEGRTLTWSQRPVRIDLTRPIRERALAIIAWVIEHGSWLAALDALSALETAIHRVAPSETRQVGDSDKFRAEWRPERLKGLAIYEKAIAKHSSVAVRYEIRQTLKRDLAFEEDPEFGEQCGMVLQIIPEDLELRTAIVLLSQGTFEFKEIGVPRTDEAHARVQELWNERIRESGRELAAKYPDACSLHDFLNQLTGELVKAGNHPSLTPLFATFAQTSPELAVALAHHILDLKNNSILAREWPPLAEKNACISPSSRDHLLEKAVRSGISGATVAVIGVLAWRTLHNQALSDLERALLLEITPRADPNEASSLLQFVEWSTDANLPWAFEILEKLPIRDISTRMLDRILEAIVPYRQRKVRIPPSTIRHVLGELVSVSDLDFFHHSREWDILSQEYPRLVYQLVHDRIAYAASAGAKAGYRAVPSGYRHRLNLDTLARQPEYPSICVELWSRILNPEKEKRYSWLQLFQAVVLANSDLWIPRLLAEIAGAESEDELLWLAQIPRFEGSLLIFRFPQVTRAFLQRAQTIGGAELLKKIRTELYIGCGPQTRSYSNGILDKELDYVEAEAVKVAEKHSSDELLGPFYRWIVEAEQKNRLMHKIQAEADIASLD